LSTWLRNGRPRCVEDPTTIIVVGVGHFGDGIRNVNNAPSRVLKDPDALAASTRKVPPFAVIRAFYGRVALKLSKKLGASSEAWVRAKQAAVDANVGAQIESDGSLSIGVAEPFVFGFEVVQLNYLTQHLGSKVDDVALAPVPADLFSR
jgi:hypothetical protein